MRPSHGGLFMPSPPLPAEKVSAAQALADAIRTATAAEIDELARTLVATDDSHRPHTPTSLVGPVCYQRAYYLCRRCGQGLFPFDQQAGLTDRNLTPGLERVV